MNNRTLMQFFEWYLPADGTFWNFCTKQALKLAQSGITEIWLPPAYKGAAGKNDVGYGVYDLFDLGEFDQKGTISTKYGTKKEYLRAVESFQKQGIQVYGDVVLNHRMGADEKETIHAVKDCSSNRNDEIHGEEEVQVWTKFTFPGRKGKYSDFQWNWTHFDGTDWDDERKECGVFKFDGKNWDTDVDSENGNYDFLMGDDLDMGNCQVVEELKHWGRWYYDTTKVDGFRLDAVKHIHFEFFKEWLDEIRSYAGRDLFAVGEYWSPEVKRLEHFLQICDGCMSLFDVPLHFHFHQASTSGGYYDMRTLFSDTLATADGFHTVTFVDNHDTQPGQALESWVEDWFKPIAYAMILLQEKGIPCVFFGDYYGIPHSNKRRVPGIGRMLRARAELAYGYEHDYFDHCDVVGFTREGDEEHPDSGLAVLASDGPGGTKTMFIGRRHAGTEFYDCLNHCTETVKIDENGNGTFWVNGGSVSVWIRRKFL